MFGDYYRILEEMDGVSEFKMSWDYRVVKDKDGMYRIAEVYYSEGRKPYAWSDWDFSPLTLHESRDRLKEETQLVAQAFGSPVLVEVEDAYGLRLVEE